MKIFSTPLSLDKKTNNNNLSSKPEDEALEEPQSHNNNDRAKDKPSQTGFQSPSSPQYSRNERIMSNGAAVHNEPVPIKEVNGFESTIEDRKYGSSQKIERYKFGNEENSRVLNEHAIKNEAADDKRAQLLKKHGNI